MHLANSELPFGGVGNSGLGSYHGFRSFATYTHEKAVLRKYPAIDEMPGHRSLMQARFPPYDGLKGFLVRTFGTRFVMKLVNPPLAASLKFAAKALFLALLLQLGL